MADPGMPGSRDLLGSAVLTRYALVCTKRESSEILDLVPIDAQGYIHVSFLDRERVDFLSPTAL